MKNNLLIELNFRKLLMGTTPDTLTGHNIFEKYINFLHTNSENYALVNMFINEAKNHTYDNGICEVLGVLSDYINNNKTGWALASVCENIMRNDSELNILNRNAARRVENFLEEHQSEEEIQKTIRAGLLNDVIFCEGFRSIIKNVFGEHPLIEKNDNYLKVTPISVVEELDEDLVLFCIEGKQYTESKSTGIIADGGAYSFSNTNKVISTLLSSKYVNIKETDIEIVLDNQHFIVNSENLIRIVPSETNMEYKEVTAAEFRENTYKILRLTRPGRIPMVSAILEAIAKLAENYGNVMLLDNAAVYTTASDKFVIIASHNQTKLFAELLASNHSMGWNLFDGALNVLNFVYESTGVSLYEEYKTQIDTDVDAQSQNEYAEAQTSALEAEKEALKNRISNLSEKFNNNPIRLQILSRLAENLREI